MHLKTPPLFKKRRLTGFTSFAALRSPFFRIFDSILHYYSSPTRVVGDWPEAQAGKAPAGAPGDAEEARMDEEITNLLGFLGGGGAT